jgi:hypothetical protein
MSFAPVADPTRGPGRAAQLIAALCLAGALSLAGSSRGNAWREAPPPGLTGGFGEETCQSCHFQAEPDDGPGSLVIDGVPERPVGGDEYRISVALVHPDLAAAGFQLSARFADGTQAGTFTVDDQDAERIGITTDAGVQYVHHLLGGTVPDGDSARWTLTWTAPAGAREIRFHAVANAGDDDESPLGDFIYTARAVLQQSPNLPPRR